MEAIQKAKSILDTEGLEAEILYIWKYPWSVVVKLLETIIVWIRINLWEINDQWDNIKSA